MQEITVKLETVTPLFLGGAEPRGEPELRPPAFRGAMRYWLRALLGGIYDYERDERSFRDDEKSVFGNASDKKGYASPISIRRGAEQIKRPYSSFTQVAEQFTNDRGKKQFRKPGVAYLFFSAREEKQSHKPERKAIEGKFIYTFSTRPGLEDNESILKATYASLWLLTHLGGLGSRSRRGAGSLQVLETIQAPAYLSDLPIKVSAENANELAKELANGIGRTRKWLSGGEYPVLSSAPEFDILHPKYCQIWVIGKSKGGTFDGWEQAIDEMGKAFQGFRNRRDTDYTVIKTSMDDYKGGKKTPLRAPVERAAFGLPIVYRYQSLDGQTSTLESEEHERRSSPLCFHVTKLANEKYVIVAVWFKSQFLHAREKLKLVLGNGKEEYVSSTVPGDNLISEFMTQSDSQKGSSLSDKGFSIVPVRLEE